MSARAKIVPGPFSCVNATIWSGPVATDIAHDDSVYTTAMIAIGHVGRQLNRTPRVAGLFGVDDRRLEADEPENRENEERPDTGLEQVRDGQCVERDLAIGRDESGTRSSR